MQVTRYEDNNFYYIWKPHGIASTFGMQKSFLDQLISWMETSEGQFFSAQKEFFTIESEFGLLNRLDNDTAGLLYFAKNPLTKKRYRKLQLEEKIQKIYLAEVEWNLLYHSDKIFTITTAIAHHKFKNDRMVVIPHENSEKYIAKIKGKQHQVQTKVQPLYFDNKKNSTVCRVVIVKWIRHQIRAHLSSIGAAILGDKIYNKKTQEIKLHLWSIGIKIENINF